MAISIRLSKEEETLFKRYAQLQRKSVSEMIRNTVIEKIEDEIDLRTYREALEDLADEHVPLQVAERRIRMK